MKAVFKTSVIADGPMGRTTHITAEEYARRKKFIEQSFGSGAHDPVMVESAHGKHVHVATLDDSGKAIPECDGLYTEVPNLPIMITHQDCVPIVITDDAGSFVCVIHAGWKGVIAGILPEALRIIEERGFELKLLNLFFGPALQVCHFEVQEDVASQFRRISPYAVTEREGKLFVDMNEALRVQAVQAGVERSRMTMSEDCTLHDAIYASWRREKEAVKNMITVAMLVL
jgi:YfiH family protein